MPHRKPVRPSDAGESLATVLAPPTALAVGGGEADLGFERGRLVRTRSAAPSNATSTVPSVSVRYT
jgi:hypothetical protein